MYQVYSAKTNQGGRPYQQDRLLVIELQDKSIYIIFDGHGTAGGDIAEYLKTTCNNYLNGNDKILKMSDKQIIISCFHEMELSLRQSSLDCHMSGSTCSMVIVNSTGMCCIGYVGDSSILICRKYKNDYQVRFASKNHNCDDIEERSRIEENGGRVERSDPRNLI